VVEEDQDVVLVEHKEQVVQAEALTHLVMEQQILVEVVEAQEQVDQVW
jgi:hypothetical protein